MSRPESHIFGLTHAEKVTAISAACHLLKKAITVKYYCHNSKVYQSMSKGLLAPSQPFSFLWCNWTQQSVCKRKEYFCLIIICVLVCLEIKCIRAGQILHPLAYLFIELTHIYRTNSYSYIITFSLCINFWFFLWLGLLILSLIPFPGLKHENYSIYPLFMML